MNELQEIEEPLVAQGSPWGPWATGGFGILILAIWNLVQPVVVLVLGRGAEGVTDFFSQGWIVARAVLVSAPIPLGAALLLASVRKGLGVGVYLGLSWPPAREAIRWSLLFLGLLVASDALSIALGRPVVPEPMMPLYRTTGSLPAFLLGIVVAAPLAEEFLFRGFVQTGLVRSRLRPLGGIVLTALAWGTLHLQYDAYGIATVIAMGLLLGVIRWRTVPSGSASYCMPWRTPWRRSRPSRASRRCEGGRPTARKGARLICRSGVSRRVRKERSSLSWIGGRRVETTGRMLLERRAARGE